MTKSPTGLAAKNMTPTATTTAVIMIGRSSDMPIAVSMESTENTTSRTTICKMIIAKLVLAARTPNSSPASAGSSLCLISVVDFQIRNAPPAIRIRSRREKAVS